MISRFPLRPALFLAPLLLVGPILLTGCGDTPPPHRAETVKSSQNTPLPSLTDKNADNPSIQAGATGLGVNAYLWRGALDTLSFMPLASADPFSGVIITNWFQPAQANGERFKATAYILGRELRSDALKISVYHQVQQNGQWVDTPVSDETVGELEDKVFARARQLRERAEQQ